MSRIVSFLRSPRLALSVIGLLAAWTGVGAWAPWMQPQGPAAPAWAVAVGLDRDSITNSRKVNTDGQMSGV